MYDEIAEKSVPMHMHARRSFAYGDNARSDDPDHGSVVTVKGGAGKNGINESV